MTNPLNTIDVTADLTADLASQFVHLHVHTEYSLLDGSIQVPRLVSALSAMGQSACAITDHASMHGVIEFSLACAKAGINGVIGCELNVVTFSSELSSPSHHLVILAENNAGWSNLIKLCSLAATKGTSLAGPDSYAVTLDDLREHATGLICLTSCTKGELAKLVQLGRNECASLFLDALVSIFGRSNLFVELTDNMLAEQLEIRESLVRTARNHSLGIVATGDVHYLRKSDKQTHISLLAIKHKLKRPEVQTLDHEEYDFSLATGSEMAARFADYPDAIANTRVIADRCKVTLTTNVFYMPDFRETPDESADDCLCRLSRLGLESRKSTIAQVQGSRFTDDVWSSYKERLEYELSVIKAMKFAGYFLIVQDFINWAKNQNIPVGPGRGSAAGSIVTYALRITNIDPIRFNLLFERFLNPERISMPDIDTDFCQDRRQEVLDYCYRRYGQSNVSQIVTFGRMMARNAIKNLARISGWSFNDSNDFAKLIPESPGITLADALKDSDALRDRLARDERARDLWDESLTIEGTLSSLGIHAAGVIISDRPLDELCPVMESEGQILTQIEHKYAEKIGLIKFDFLGLKTLTTINKAVQFVSQTRSVSLDIDNIDLEDPRVYEMISTACVTGVFQLESSGMRKLVSELRPSCFSDIVAILALFRPGPLGSGMVDDFVLRKHGEKAVEYPLPQLEDILADTYGVIVFQEQVQKIAAVLANYSLGEADLLRRAMGKKDAKEMEKQKARFVSGCEENKIDPQIASDIFDLMAKFAEYGFNKSHTAAYGFVTYQTAFLKTYYPTCFMAAIMSCDLGDTDKIVTYLRDCKRMGIPIDPPDINSSTYEFQVSRSDSIVYGLGAIKGVGKGICEEIVAERLRGGPFIHLPEFIARVGARKLNKKVIESFIKAGAFDCFDKNRNKLMVNMDNWLRTISREQERVVSVGAGLFDDPDQSSGDLASLLLGIQQTEAGYWPLLVELEHEKSVLGTYLSGHPADLFESDFKVFRTCQLAAISKQSEVSESNGRGKSPEGGGYQAPKPIRIAGLLTSLSEKRTKDGEKFAILKLEDSSGDVEVSIFPQQYAALDFRFVIGEPMWMSCIARKGIELGSVRLSCRELGRIDDLIKDRRRILSLRLKHAENWLENPQRLDELLEYFHNHPGPSRLEIELSLADERMNVRANVTQATASSSLAVLNEIDKRWPRLIEASALYRERTSGTNLQ
jgi:DNA polymerase-3 subunit alpha